MRPPLHVVLLGHAPHFVPLFPAVASLILRPDAAKTLCSIACWLSSCFAVHLSSPCAHFSSISSPQPPPHPLRACSELACARARLPGEALLLEYFVPRARPSFLCQKMSHLLASLLLWKTLRSFEPAFLCHAAVDAAALGRPASPLCCGLHRPAPRRALPMNAHSTLLAKRCPAANTITSSFTNCCSRPRPSCARLSLLPDSRLPSHCTWTSPPASPLRHASTLAACTPATRVRHATGGMQTEACFLGAAIRGGSARCIALTFLNQGLPQLAALPGNEHRAHPLSFASRSGLADALGAAVAAPDRNRRSQTSRAAP